MIHNYKPQAKRYAIAFLNCYESELESKYIKGFSQLALFLKNNRWIYAYLNISNISHATRLTLIEKLCSVIKLPSCTHKLILLLLERKKLTLLDSVLDQVALLYRMRKGEMAFTISTAHSLSDEEKDQIIQQLHNLVTPLCTAHYVLDPSLINGIKIQSSTLLWERSVKKVIRSINLSCLNGYRHD